MKRSRILARLLLRAAKNVAAASKPWLPLHQAADASRTRARAVARRAFARGRAALRRQELLKALESRDAAAVEALVERAIARTGESLRVPFGRVLARVQAQAGAATAQRLNKLRANTIGFGFGFGFEDPKQVRQAAFNPDQPRDEDGQWSSGGGSLPSGPKAVVVPDSFDMKEVKGIRRIMIEPNDLKVVIGPDMENGSDEFMDATHAVDFEDATGSSKNFDNYVRGFITKDEIMLTDAGLETEGVSSFPDAAAKFDAYTKVLDYLVKYGGATKNTDVTGIGDVVRGKDTQKLSKAFPFLFEKKRNAAFNPDQPRDEDGKWTAGGSIPLHDEATSTSEKALKKLDDIADGAKFVKTKDVFSTALEGEEREAYLEDFKLIPDALREAGTEKTLTLKDIVASQPTVEVAVVKMFIRDTELAAMNEESEDGPLPLLVKWRDRLVVGDGHHRFSAYKMKGIKNARTEYVDLDEFKKRRNAAFNPDQPRDEKGRFAPVGSSASSALTKTLKGDVVKDEDPKLEKAFKQGRAQILVKPKVQQVKSPYGANYCHQNTAKMWKPGGSTDIMTGYYADAKEPGGAVWRPHSWLMRGNKVLETTGNKATHYVGVRLTEAEAKRFKKSGGLL